MKLDRILVHIRSQEFYEAFYAGVLRGPRSDHDERVLAMVAAGVGHTTMPESYLSGANAARVQPLRMNGFHYERAIGLILRADPLKDPLSGIVAGIAKSYDWPGARIALRKSVL